MHLDAGLGKARAREPLGAKFMRKAFVVRSLAEVQDHRASGAELQRVFTAVDLVVLGVGCTVGAGIMVLTGVAAHDNAGPGVVVSYALAGFAALLSSLCYAEFAADIPVTGGAFNYIGMTFGEFFAWVAAMDLILEYTLSASAIAKGFTAYMASLCNADLQKVRLQAGLFTLDFPALGAVVVLSLVLLRSTKESALLNVIMVTIHMVLIVFVMCAGFPFADTANYQPFLPFGVRGVFAGAAVVFFSFIGFDTVSTAAEEAIDPGHSLPIGIVGSLCITTLLYVLMCLVITGMQPYQDINRDAPFSVAFEKVGVGWAGKVVSVGALVGIVTALLGALLGQARIYVTLGRQGLLPPWLARVSDTTHTPQHATLLTMCTAGLLALLLDIEQLAKMVSIGTLVVFTMVCAGVLFRRYHVRAEGASTPLAPILTRLAAVAVCSVGASVTYTLDTHMAAPLTFLGCWAVATASFHMLPVRFVPQLFRCPLSPWLPSLGMLCCLHLIGSLGWPAYVRWGVWFCLGTAVYLCYGVHHTQHEGAGPRGIGVFHLSHSDPEGFDEALACGRGGGGGDDDAAGAGAGDTELTRLGPGGGRGHEHGLAGGGGGANGVHGGPPVADSRGREEAVRLMAGSVNSSSGS